MSLTSVPPCALFCDIFQTQAAQKKKKENYNKRKGHSFMLLFFCFIGFYSSTQFFFPHSSFFFYFVSVCFPVEVSFLSGIIYLDSGEVATRHSCKLNLRSVGKLFFFFFRLPPSRKRALNHSTLSGHYIKNDLFR